MELTKSIPAPEQADAELKGIYARKSSQSLNLSALLVKEFRRVLYLGLQIMLVRIRNPDGKT